MGFSQLPLIVDKSHIHYNSALSHVFTFEKKEKVYREGGGKQKALQTLARKLYVLTVHDLASHIAQ